MRHARAEKKGEEKEPESEEPKQDQSGIRRLTDAAGHLGEHEHGEGGDGGARADGRGLLRPRSGKQFALHQR